MQAIRTTFAGPTNHNGSRIIAKCDAGRRVYAWNYALGVEENHRAAALALSTELGWIWPDCADSTCTETHLPSHGLATGALPGQSGYAHVLTRP